MSEITTRATGTTGVQGVTRKDAPLSNAEIDNNFINLNNNKLEVSDLSTTNTANAGVKRDASGNFSAGTITASLSGNATTATTATNLAGGGAGTVPYNSAEGTTVQLGAGSNGQVYRSNGAAAPSWMNQSSIAAGTATTLATSRSIGDITFNGSSDIVPARMAFRDTRADNHAPYTYSGVSLHFKQNSTSGLSDGGTYHGILNLWPYSDASGGIDHEIAVTDNGNLFHRHGGGDGWGSWKRVISSNNGSNYLQIDSLGVGTAATGTTGQIVATNSITSYYSDQRLKENITPLENALDKIDQLAGVLYTQNKLAEEFGYTNYEQQVGVLAQQVQAVQPEAVKLAPFDLAEDGSSKSGENYLTVQYEKLVPLLIEGIKELRKEIKELKEIK